MGDNVFRKRSGTTDLGRDYEDLTVANLALRLVTDPAVINFKISSNDEEFGAFDDVVVEIETETDKQLYALQLKQKNKNAQALIKSSLEAERGNFSIKKYFESYKAIKKRANCKFILLTNLKFDTDSYTNVDLVEQEQPFSVEIKGVDPLKILKIFSKGSEYRFEIKSSFKPEEYKIFFDNFFLYTNQLNVEDTKRDVVSRFQQIFSCTDVESDKYLQFITQWSLLEGNKEKLDKNFMQQAIALILLNKFIKPLSSGEVNEKMKLLRQAITNFDTTIFQEEAWDKVVQLWGDVKSDWKTENNKEGIIVARKFQFLGTRDVFDDLDDKTSSKLLWLMEKCPLVVTHDPAVYKAICLCSHKKYILLTSQLLHKELPESSKIFRNLLNLEAESQAYPQIIKTFSCSTQGKREVSLEFLIALNEKFKEIITTDELVKMVDGAYHIGEEKEKVPTPYISRTVSINLIDIRYLKNIDMDTLIVFDCMGKLDKIKTRLGNFNLIDVGKYLREDSVKDVENVSPYEPLHKPLYHTSPCLKNFVSGPDIYVSKMVCSRNEFEQIYQKNCNVKRIHHLKIINETTLEWVASKGDVSDLERYRREDEFIEENELYGGQPENNVNLINGDPGMGKSELLKNIKNNSSFEFWSILLHSNDTALLCSRLEGSRHDQREKILEEFILETLYHNLPTFDKRVIQLFMEKYKVAYFWDALDEITTKSIDVILELIQILTQKSSFQWITSRCHLKKQLERKFNVLSKSLSQLDEQQQNSYICERLQEFYSAEDIKKVIDVIRSTVTLVKHNDVLGTPLQIFMFTELFRQDRDKYLGLLEKVFSLTDLYQHIIDEKFNRYYEEKADVRTPNDALRSVLQSHKKSMYEKYEKAGLKALIKKEIFKQLNINCDEFLTEIQDRADSIGLITEVTDSFPQFLHNSYAEFFVAKYFTEHYTELKNYFENIYFDSKYANVKFFFDLLTAKDSEAHVAVIYGNIDLLKQQDCDLNNCEDEGGRNVLQLACSWGQRCPVLPVEKKDQTYIIDNENDDSSIGDNSDHMEILQYLLDNCDASEADDIFKVTSLAYAEKSDNILAKLKIFLKQKKIFSISNNDESLSILYYSTKFGYDEVLDLFETVPFVKTKKENFSLLHLAVTYGHENYLKKLLSIDIYQTSINEADNYGETPLYEACQNGYYTIVKLLVDHGANINAATTNGSTPLHTSCLHSHHNIAKFLLKSGANVNIPKDFNITPLHVACWNGHGAVVDFLLKNGAGINMAAADGCTPLYVASRNKHNAIVALLGASGAEINLPQYDGVTPLFIACQEGHVRNVELLLKSGADANLATSNGQSPLYIACQNGHKNVVKMLIDSGADLEVSASNRWTPLQIACQQGHVDVVEVLMGAGADVNVGMADGTMPWKIAEVHGQECIASILIHNCQN